MSIGTADGGVAIVGCGVGAFETDVAGGVTFLVHDVAYEAVGAGVAGDGGMEKDGCGGLHG